MRWKHALRAAIAVALVTVFLSSLSFGQTRRHDLSVSYGLVTIDQLADIFEDILLITITLGTFAKGDLDFSGAPFLTYHYSPRGRFGFGLAVGGYRTTGSLINNITDEVVGDYKENNTVAALEIDYHWVMKRSFQLYSGAGFGLRFRKGTYNAYDSVETTNVTVPTFHVNVLGFRVGQKVGFFGEAGFGYKGVICAGLNAQF